MNKKVVLDLEKNLQDLRVKISKLNKENDEKTSLLKQAEIARDSALLELKSEG